MNLTIKETVKHNKFETLMKVFTIAKTKKKGTFLGINFKTLKNTIILF